jgi:hypothetical protein
MTDQWCPATVELDSRDPNVAAVIDCERKLTDRNGHHRDHQIHTRTLELDGGVLVEIRWHQQAGTP